MPFRFADYNGKLFQTYLREGISVVVVLAEAEECQQRTGRDLLAFYRLQGLEVIHCPISDFSVPEQGPMKLALETVAEKALAGKHAVVHCYAGFGRTGTFMACLAHRLLGMNGETAIKWVRTHIPTALESEAQVQFVQEYAGRSMLDER